MESPFRFALVFIPSKLASDGNNTPTLKYRLGLEMTEKLNNISRLGLEKQRVIFLRLVLVSK